MQLRGFSGTRFGCGCTGHRKAVCRAILSIAISVEKLGISEQLVTWEYQKVIQYNEENVNTLLIEQH